MPTIRMRVIAATYAAREAAIADFERATSWGCCALRRRTFDAAVAVRRADGALCPVGHVEHPRLGTDEIGAGFGLAVGALAAVHPGCSAEPSSGSTPTDDLAVRVLAEEVTAGMEPDHLRELGQVLDAGDGALVVVTDAYDSTAAAAALEACSRSWPLVCGPESLEESMDEAARARPSAPGGGASIPGEGMR